MARRSLANNSLTKLWWLPNIAEEVGRKRNVCVKKLLFCFFQRFCSSNFVKLKVWIKYLSATGTTAKWITGFVFVLVVFVVS